MPTGMADRDRDQPGEEDAADDKAHPCCDIEVEIGRVEVLVPSRETDALAVPDPEVVRADPDEWSLRQVPDGDVPQVRPGERPATGDVLRLLPIKWSGGPRRRG